MDRFKSALVESGPALETMAAYIDLNPVRVDLVKDPTLYEWSGYGEAVGGSRSARRARTEESGEKEKGIYSEKNGESEG